MLPEGMLPKVSPLELRLALLRALQTPLAVLPGSMDKEITDSLLMNSGGTRGRPNTVEHHCLLMIAYPAHQDHLKF